MGKQLSLINHLRCKVTGHVPDKNRLPKYVKVEQALKPDEIRLFKVMRVDAIIGATINIDNDLPPYEAERFAKEAIGKMLCHELYKDLRNEIMELKFWALQEGLGRDLDSRVDRILDYIEGKEIEDIEDEHL